MAALSDSDVLLIATVISVLAASYAVLAYIVLPMAWTYHQRQPGLACRGH
jgi:hypothetical protein